MSYLGVKSIWEKDKTKAIVIAGLAVLISAIFGIGSTNMSGHESVIFPFLETLFLLIYAIALISISVNYYNNNSKKTGNIILLSLLVAVGLGYVVFACLHYYL